MYDLFELLSGWLIIKFFCTIVALPFKIFFWVIKTIFELIKFLYRQIKKLIIYIKNKNQLKNTQSNSNNI